jgi:hypothetical protein
MPAGVEAAALSSLAEERSVFFNEHEHGHGSRSARPELPEAEVGGVAEG